MKELVIDAKTENLDEVLAFVEAELEAHDCPMRTQIQLNIAVEELFVNIAHYAYKPGTGQATIQLEVINENDRPMAQITFIDKGVAYNPLEREDPDVTLSAEQRKIGGLGIYMVKKSMDKVSYERRDDQNVFMIARYL